MPRKKSFINRLKFWKHKRTPSRHHVHVRRKKESRKKQRVRKNRQNRKIRACDPNKTMELDGIIVTVDECRRTEHKTQDGLMHTMPVVKAKMDPKIKDKVSPEGKKRIKEVIKKGIVLVEEEGVVVTSVEYYDDKIVGRCPAGTDIIVINKDGTGSDRKHTEHRCGQPSRIHSKEIKEISRKRSLYQEVD